MNIGFVNIYPWRPHGFHAGFLEYQCNLLGHSTFFLECGGSLDMCTAKLHHTNGNIPCIKCHLGRVSKYNNNKVFTISSKIPRDRLSHAHISKRLLSSVLALFREEVDLDYTSNERIAQSIDKLTNNYLRTYYSTLNLIEKKKYTSSYCF